MRKKVTIATSGIYEYDRSELNRLGGIDPYDIPAQYSETQTFKVYRPATVLRRDKDKFAGAPLTHNHPQELVTPENYREYATGHITDNIDWEYIPEAGEYGITAYAYLSDEEAIDAYNNGELQLSAGYFAKYSWAYNPNYEIILNSIDSVNHVAQLKYGRGGHTAAIMDAKNTNEDITMFKFNKTNNYKKMQLWQRAQATKFTRDEANSVEKINYLFDNYQDLENDEITAVIEQVKTQNENHPRKDELFRLLDEVIAIKTAPEDLHEFAREEIIKLLNYEPAPEIKEETEVATDETSAGELDMERKIKEIIAKEWELMKAEELAKAAEQTADTEEETKTEDRSPILEQTPQNKKSVELFENFKNRKK